MLRSWHANEHFLRLQQRLENVSLSALRSQVVLLHSPGFLNFSTGDAAQGRSPLIYTHVSSLFHARRGEERNRCKLSKGKCIRARSSSSQPSLIQTPGFGNIQNYLRVFSIEFREYTMRNWEDLSNKAVVNCLQDK